jgi:hypothetical protein
VVRLVPGAKSRSRIINPLPDTKAANLLVFIFLFSAFRFPPPEFRLLFCASFPLSASLGFFGLGTEQYERSRTAHAKK